MFIGSGAIHKRTAGKSCQSVGMSGKSVVIGVCLPPSLSYCEMYPHTTGEVLPEDGGEGVAEVRVHMSVRCKSLVLARWEEKSLSEEVGGEHV